MFAVVQQIIIYLIQFQVSLLNTVFSLFTCLFSATLFPFLFSITVSCALLDVTHLISIIIDNSIPLHFIIKLCWTNYNFFSQQQIYSNSNGIFTEKLPIPLMILHYSYPLLCHTLLTSPSLTSLSVWHTFSFTHARAHTTENIDKKGL